MNLIAYLQPTKQVMPAVRPFDHPTSGFETRVLLAFLFFLAARLDMRNVAATLGRLTQLRIVVTLVAAQMLARFLSGRGPRNNHRIKGDAKLLHVVPVGSRECNRQRDAVGIRQEVSLGAQFAPIRGVFSGLVPPLTGAEMMTPSSDWKRQSMPRRSS